LALSGFFSPDGADVALPAADVSWVTAAALIVCGGLFGRICSESKILGSSRDSTGTYFELGAF
jgi:hypothetical protein